MKQIELFEITNQVQKSVAKLFSLANAGRYKERFLYSFNPRSHFYYCGDCTKPLRFFFVALGDHSGCDIDRLPF